MAFPTVVATSGGHDTSTTTSTRNAVLPTGGSTGDLLLIALGSFSNPVVATSTPGWSIIHQGGNSPVIALFAGILGTASTPLVITTSFAAETAHNSFDISGWSGTIADITFAFTTGQSSANAQSPTLTNAASNDYLWITGVSIANGSIAVTAGPSGWTHFFTNKNAALTGGDMYTAELSATASAETPGPWTNSSRGWTAFTLSVPPVASTVIPLGVASETDAAHLITPSLIVAKRALITGSRDARNNSYHW